jgi:hypothetical protein
MNHVLLNLLSWNLSEGLRETEARLKFEADTFMMGFMDFLLCRFTDRIPDFLTKVSFFNLFYSPAILAIFITF